METIEGSGMSSIPQKCPQAGVVNISVLHFVKSLLRCEDCHIFPQLANTNDITWSEREAELLVET